MLFFIYLFVSLFLLQKHNSKKVRSQTFWSPLMWGRNSSCSSRRCCRLSPSTPKQIRGVYLAPDHKTFAGSVVLQPLAENKQFCWLFFFFLFLTSQFRTSCLFLIKFIFSMNIFLDSTWQWQTDNKVAKSVLFFRFSVGFFSPLQLAVGFSPVFFFFFHHRKQSGRHPEPAYLWEITRSL